MITIQDYVGIHANSPDWTPARQRYAALLLDAVNPLLERYYRETGNRIRINPATHSQISGQTFGGFRPQSCQEGAPGSSHKEAMGIDAFDPDNEFDDWLTDDILAEHKLYREHPDKTPGWCHLTTRRPPSGHRTFWP